MAHPLPIYPAGWYRAIHRHFQATKAWTLSYLVSPTGVGSTMTQALADHLSDSYSTNFFQILAQKDVAYQQLEVRDVHDYSNAPLISTTGAHTMSGGDPPLPTEVTAVVSLRTALIGRRHRGRMYFSGLAEGAYDHLTGLWTTSALPVIQGAADTWRSDSNSSSISFAGSNWGVGHDDHVGGGTVQLVTHLIVNTQPCSQRRRQALHRGRL